MGNKTSEITWGAVTAVSPALLVMFSGDAVASPVGLKDPALSLLVTDKVILARVGKPFGWAVVSKLGAS
jgi:hypothetical protein